MADILPRPAGCFPPKCAKAKRCGQPEKMAEIEMGEAIETPTKKCHLRFRPILFTVRFVAEMALNTWQRHKPWSVSRDLLWIYALA
jgi:hypothetical protein